MVPIPSTQTDKHPRDTGYWLTSVFIFKGTAVPFAGKALAIKDIQWSPIRAEAERRAAVPPSSVTITLEAGPYVLVGVDELGAYFDNPGMIVLNIAVAS